MKLDSQVRTGLDDQRGQRTRQPFESLCSVAFPSDPAAEKGLRSLGWSPWQLVSPSFIDEKG